MRRGRGEWKKPFPLGGVKSLPLLLGLVNGVESGQGGQASFPGPAVSQEQLFGSGSAPGNSDPGTGAH